MKLFAATSVPGILLNWHVEVKRATLFVRVVLKANSIFTVLDLKIRLTLAASPAIADAKSFGRFFRAAKEYCASLAVGCGARIASVPGAM